MQRSRFHATEIQFSVCGLEDTNALRCVMCGSYAPSEGKEYQETAFKAQALH